MDLAYDYMQEAEALPKNQGGASSASNPEQQPSLNDDIQDAYKAISSSAWGIKIGGFLGTVVKQVTRHSTTAFLHASNLRRASPSTTKPRRSLPRSAKMRPRA